MVKKTKLPENTGRIRKTDVSGEFLTFSFRYFTIDNTVSPTEQPDGYLHVLIERLRALSGWTIAEFLNSHSKAIRIHPIDWAETSRPDGFAHLPQQLRDGVAFQFSLTGNKYGRVHGLLVGGVYQVIWLDCNHRVYSK